MGLINYRLFAEALGSGQDFKLTKAGPFLTGGLEFRIQNRVGIGLNVNYDLFSAKGTVGDTGVVEAKLNPLSVEPTLAIYF